MTIFTTFTTKSPGKKSMRRKHRLSLVSDFKARFTRAFSEQWKRYPNCRKVLNIRTGFVTHSGIFPEGYDPTYERPTVENFPPIKG